MSLENSFYERLNKIYTPVMNINETELGSVAKEIGRSPESLKSFMGKYGGKKKFTTKASIKAFAKDIDDDVIGPGAKWQNTIKGINDMQMLLVSKIVSNLEESYG